jgi:hypothetical protein
MYPLPLEAFASLEVCPLGHDGLVLLSVVAQTLLCNFLCAGSPSLLSGDAEAVAGVELPKELFTFRARRMHIIIE